MSAPNLKNHSVRRRQAKAAAKLARLGPDRAQRELHRQWARIVAKAGAQ